MATRQRQNLGQGWWEMEDANGRVYYANKQTKQTSWKKPVLEAEPVQETRVSRQSATKENDSRPSAAPAQEVWREVVDKKSGKTYYYNKETKETRWTNPAAESKRAESAASASTGLESVYPDAHPRKLYVEKVEPQSGRSYWVNLKTRATSWNPPEGWDTSADDDRASTQTSSAVQSQVAAASEDEEEDAGANDAAPADGTQAGVGLFFDTHARSGGSMVKAIYSGSSAARCGKISIGDILCFVDGQDVKSQGPSIVRLMIVGPQGSYVALGFCKEGRAADVYEVKLLRGSAESIAVLAAKGLELHAEIDALTQVLLTPNIGSN
jgi:C-terminal processing protease CtpA/Prc